MRAAAVADFFRDLQARGSADLNAVLTTLNEGGLCREAVARWVGAGWIAVAPNSPLVALAGPALSRDVTLSRFCGIDPPPEEASESAPADDREDSREHHDS